MIVTVRGLHSSWCCDIRGEGIFIVLIDSTKILYQIKPTYIADNVLSTNKEILLQYIQLYMETRIKKFNYNDQMYLYHPVASSGCYQNSVQIRALKQVTTNKFNLSRSWWKAVIHETSDMEIEKLKKISTRREIVLDQSFVYTPTLCPKVNHRWGDVIQGGTTTCTIAIYDSFDEWRN